MDASLRRPPRSLSSRALSDTSNTRKPACGSEDGDGAAKGGAPVRSNSSRTEKEALQAALLRHRTLELQARLRAASPLSPSGLNDEPGATHAQRPDLLPLPTSLPGGVSRTALAGAAGAAALPVGARGSAALSPEEELRGCLCGGGANHRARTFTVADWFDTWGAEVRTVFMRAGTALWGGNGGNGDARGDAHPGSAPAAQQQQAAPRLVPMVVMAS